jgi:glycosyltransferase involved in cell wall biosynthesis
MKRRRRSRRRRRGGLTRLQVAGEAGPCSVPGKRVLFVLHNHPSVQAGGSEAYTLNVYETLRRSGEFEPMIVARVNRPGQPGNRFVGLEGDPNQYLVEIPDEGYDFTFQTFRDKSLYTRDFADFLTTHKPDVVHFQHHLYIGCDLISAIRRILPSTPIVYTLHEYLPICNHYGQLIRSRNAGAGLCLEASPRRCHECFPDISHQAFFLRKRFIQSHFSEVDLFIAPSRFLLERYVDWGIPADRIRHEQHGFPAVTPVGNGATRPRNRFAFFGVLTPFKGIDVLLTAMQRLGPDFGGHLSIHATGKVQMPDESEEVQGELDRLLATTSGTVTFCGPYDHDRDMPRLMAETDWVVVPSIWWENSPLVIAEAFQHGRPVICSDIGGMAEKVTNGENGLLFRVGDPGSLAQVMGYASSLPGLWESLRAGIPAVRGMDDHVAALMEIYRTLIERHASENAGARSPALAG